MNVDTLLRMRSLVIVEDLLAGCTSTPVAPAPSHHRGSEHA